MLDLQHVYHLGVMLLDCIFAMPVLYCIFAEQTFCCCSDCGPMGARGFAAHSFFGISSDGVCNCCKDGVVCQSHMERKFLFMHSNNHELMTTTCCEKGPWATAGSFDKNLCLETGSSSCCNSEARFVECCGNRISGNYLQ